MELNEKLAFAFYQGVYFKERLNDGLHLKYKLPNDFYHEMDYEEQQSWFFEEVVLPKLYKIMIDRITPENIEFLNKNEIFVFGSNMSGRHGKGGAKTAMKWGGIYGQSNGLQGNTYGIPTVNHNITAPLLISEIKEYVDEFIEFTKNNKNLIFYVTKIGCGLAGYNVEDMASLFKECLDLDNVFLPIEFIEFNKQ